MPVKLKICGITNPADARIVVENGVEWLGFNFYPKSPRYIAPSAARRIIAELPEQVNSVGILAKPSLTSACYIAAISGVRWLQLYDPLDFTDLSRLPLPAILCFNPKTYPAESKVYKNAAMILFDSRTKSQLGGTGRTFDWKLIPAEIPRQKLVLAGGINPDNILAALEQITPAIIDVASGAETAPGIKDPRKIKALMNHIRQFNRNQFQRSSMQVSIQSQTGYFGDYGGQFIPEILKPALKELETAYTRLKKDQHFRQRFRNELRDYAGRPTPLYYAENLTRHYGRGKIYLKREDLNHTGAHKINNAIGQILIAQAMQKTRIIAETGAGQHGVATATVAARAGLKCCIYMGTEDMQRQHPNVQRMRLLGAEVRAVDSGTATLKDATNEALRDWLVNVGTTHYIIGSVVGPHPFPTIVRDFQKIIGEETQQQILEKEQRLPDYIIACVGGGSNAIGIFHPFLGEKSVKLIGVEAAGRGLDSGEHAATLGRGSVGIFHGMKTYILQNSDGQIQLPYSLSAGLDYPGVGPEHSFLYDSKRVDYHSVTDAEALSAVRQLCRLEGIIPALESAHAVAYLDYLMPQTAQNDIIVVNLSGRGDKDMSTYINHLCQPQGELS